MPTATKFFGATITNFGPLTTTPSCTTVTTDYLLYAVENLTGPYHGSPRCEHDLVGDCIPDGSSYDLLASKRFGPWELGVFNYRSPGIYCPIGRTNAAVLGHGDKAGSFEKWRLHHYSDTKQHTYSFINPSTRRDLALFVGAVRDTRFLLSKGIYIQEYDPIRFEVFTVHIVQGEPVSGSAGVLSAAPWTGTWSERLEMLTDVLPDPNRTSSLIVIRTLPASLLVYESSDIEAAGTSTGDRGENDPGEDGNKDDTKEVDDNGSGSSALPIVFGLAPVIAVLAGVLTGAGLLMP